MNKDKNFRSKNFSKDQENMINKTKANKSKIKDSILNKIRNKIKEIKKVDSNNYPM